MASTAPQKDLVEFHKVPLWCGWSSPIEKIYEKMNLVPSYEYFFKKATENAEEIMKSRHSVKPIVTRHRRIHLSNQLQQDTTNNAIISGETPLQPCESSQSGRSAPPSVHNGSPEHYSVPAQPNRKTQTARKSTTGKIAKARSFSTDHEECKICQLTLIDLEKYDLGGYMKPLLREYRLGKKRKESKMKEKVCERKNSTDDSGLATDDENTKSIPKLKINDKNTTSIPKLKINDKNIKSIPKLKINVGDLSGHAQVDEATETKATKRGAPSSTYQSKKTKINRISKGSKSRTQSSSKEAIDSHSQKQGGATQNCGLQRKTQIPVSIPLDRGLEHLRVLRLDIQNGYVKNTNNNSSTRNYNNKTILTDGIATSEFDVNKLMVSTLATKRYKDPAPLKVFSPFDEQEKRMVCIHCNKNFTTEQDLANHELANHHTFKY